MKPRPPEVFRACPAQGGECLGRTPPVVRHGACPPCPRGAGRPPQRDEQQQDIACAGVVAVVDRAAASAPHVRAGDLRVAVPAPSALSCGPSGGDFGPYRIVFGAGTDQALAHVPWGAGVEGAVHAPLRFSFRQRALPIEPFTDGDVALACGHARGLLALGSALPGLEARVLAPPGAGALVLVRPTLLASTACIERRLVRGIVRGAHAVSCGVGRGASAPKSNALMRSVLRSTSGRAFSSHVRSGGVPTSRRARGGRPSGRARRAIR